MTAPTVEPTYDHEGSHSLLQGSASKQYMAPYRIIKKVRSPINRAASNDMDSLVAKMLKITTKKTLLKEPLNDYLNNSSMLRRNEQSILGSEIREYEMSELDNFGLDNSLHVIKKKQDYNSNSILQNRVYNSKQAKPIPNAL